MSDSGLDGFTGRERELLQKMKEGVQGLVWAVFPTNHYAAAAVLFAAAGERFRHLTLDQQNALIAILLGSPSRS